MAAISTAIMAATAAVGVGTSLFGLSEQKKNQKKAQAASAQQNAAYAQQAAASVQASQASQRGEQARKDQMNLDASRAQRQALRQGIVAQSVATARAYGRGAGTGSAAQGAQSQIAGQVAGSRRDIYQNQDVGSAIFQSNYDVLQAQIAGANAGSSANYAGSLIQQAQYGINFGQSLFNLGVNIASTAQQVGQIGSGLASPGIGDFTTTVRYGS